MKPKDFTSQEKTIATVLSEIGCRYAQQVSIGQYVVDFYLEQDGKIVIEADSVYGHYKEADAQRDQDLQEMGVNVIIHIKDITKESIKQKLREHFYAWN